MKKTATKLKNARSRKQLSPAQRKSWLKIYSHVAYFFSVLNLFLFPARVNADGVPSSATALAQPLLVVAHQNGTRCLEAMDVPAGKTTCFTLPVSGHKDEGATLSRPAAAKRTLGLPISTPDACSRRSRVLNPTPSPH